MGIDLAVGTVTAMAAAALSIAIKLLLDVLRTSTKRMDAEIARLEERHEAERAEWHLERAELRARITFLEQHIVVGGGGL